VTQAQILQGIRVLDLSRIVAAPMATQILGDMGAEVIKVERPGLGDDARRYGPVFAVDQESGAPGDSAFFLACNRNKQSITIDISKPDGQELVRQLVTRCDVLVENYKVGDLAGYGLDYESLKAINPGLIYCSVTGYGQTGPYAPRPGLDIIFQAQSGLMSVTGKPDGEAGAGPQQVGLVAIDLLTGHNAAIAILAALLHRERTGEGQAIDLALFDSAVAFMSHAAQQFLLSGIAPQRHQTMGVPLGPAEVLECADGPVHILGSRDASFAAICRVLGRIDLIDDARFKTGADRFRNRLVLRETLATLVRPWKRQALLDALGAAGATAGAVNSVADVFDDPQVKARGMALSVPSSRYGDLPVVGSPFRFSATPVRYERAPPQLGEHTSSILSDMLGLGESQIDALRRQGVI